MKRIDIIYEELLNTYQGTGVTTNELATKLNLSRANVSTDLNLLVERGDARKTPGKPVIYHPIIKISELEKFARKNPSLQMVIRQAQAAVLYPPIGLNMLFYGETGVGKTMFASIIYDYAKFMKKPCGKFPFVQFNCADYANNPQLLLSQLFGVSKNAYTGADEDKVGLVEEADGGILFLDEIHRLPPEGQELFFTFIDRGVYHRLGESDIERKASVQIIAATTETPDSALLQTFQRRIPMILKIPNLAERTLEERADLVSLFFQEEAKRLQKPIKVSQNSIRAFVNYHCPHNIGQLKNDIQLACAKTYVDYIVSGHKSLMIHSPELPPNVLSGLYEKPENRDAWNKYQKFNQRYLHFPPEGSTTSQLANREPTIYDLIDAKSTELNYKELNYHDLRTIMKNNFSSFYLQNSELLDQDSQEIDKLKSFISEPLFNVCLETIRISEKLLDRKLNSKMEHALAIHIFTTYNRIRRGDSLKKHPDYQKIKEDHSDYLKIAEECLLFLNASLDIHFPEEEAVFLAMFFIYNEEEDNHQSKYVKIIVMTHGASGASSMTAFVNDLLNTEHAIGINMSIKESPSIVFSRLKKYLKDSNITEDILFLVDMGSLTNIGAEIQKEFGNKCRTIALCSTPHVLEATRKAIMGYSLEKIYRDTLAVNFYNNASAENSLSFIPEDEKKSVILTFCLTGEGTAKTMKNILETKINFSSLDIQILPVTLLQDESISNHIDYLEKQYHILCITTSFPVETAIPQFQLYDLFHQDTISRIQEIVDIDLTYREIATTLKDELHHVDSREVVPDAKTFVTDLENQLGYHLDLKAIFGLIFHVSSLIDRLKEAYKPIEFPNKELYIDQNKKNYIIVKSLMVKFEKKYLVTISDNDICFILSVLEKK